MDRRQFFQTGCCALAFMAAEPLGAEQERPACEDTLNFVRNFVHLT